MYRYLKKAITLCYISKRFDISKYILKQNYVAHNQCSKTKIFGFLFHCFLTKYILATKAGETGEFSTEIHHSKRYYSKIFGNLWALGKRNPKSKFSKSGTFFYDYTSCQSLANMTESKRKFVKQSLQIQKYTVQLENISGKVKNSAHYLSLGESEGRDAEL